MTSETFISLPFLFFPSFFISFLDEKTDHNHLRMSEKLKRVTKDHTGFSLVIYTIFLSTLAITFPNNACISPEVLLALRGLLIVDYENLWQLALF